MKQIDVNLWEITPSEVLTLSEDVQVLIYDTLYEKYLLFRASHILLYVLSCENRLFFTFNEPKFKDKETNNQ